MDYFCGKNVIIVGNFNLFCDSKRESHGGNSILKASDLEAKRYI